VHNIDGREGFERKHSGSMQAELRNLPEQLIYLKAVSL
jgi:hypothetical protein